MSDPEESVGLRGRWKIAIAAVMVPVVFVVAVALVAGLRAKGVLWPLGPSRAEVRFKQVCGEFERCPETNESAARGLREMGFWQVGRSEFEFSDWAGKTTVSVSVQPSNAWASVGFRPAFAQTLGPGAVAVLAAGGETASLAFSNPLDQAIVTFRSFPLLPQPGKTWRMGTVQDQVEVDWPKGRVLQTSREFRWGAVNSSP